MASPINAVVRRGRWPATGPGRTVLLATTSSTSAAIDGVVVSRPPAHSSARETTATTMTGGGRSRTPAADIPPQLPRRTYAPGDGACRTAVRADAEAVAKNTMSSAPLMTPVVGGVRNVGETVAGIAVSVRSDLTDDGRIKRTSWPMATNWHRR